MKCSLPRGFAILHVEVAFQERNHSAVALASCVEDRTTDLYERVVGGVDSIERLARLTQVKVLTVTGKQ